MSQIAVLELSNAFSFEENLPSSCGVCSDKSVIIIWDDRYDGFRGKCLNCKNNWPES